MYVKFNVATHGDVRCTHGPDLVRGRRGGGVEGWDKHNEIILQLEGTRSSSNGEIGDKKNCFPVQV